MQFRLIDNCLYMEVPVEHHNGLPHYRIGNRLYPPMPLLRDLKLPEPASLPRPPSRAPQAHALRAEGLSLAEIGQRMGISRQRVHQLLRPHTRTPAAPQSPPTPRLDAAPQDPLSATIADLFG